jgi:hypothetical protein
MRRWRDRYYILSINVARQHRRSLKILARQHRKKKQSEYVLHDLAGITSNRRLLVVKAGHLYYYSNIPKSFTGDNIKIL